MNKQEILTAAKAQREQEVLEYQVNIDNFRTALALLEQKTPEEREPLLGFQDQLRELEKSNRLEQSKSQLMLDAINAQLG